MTTSAKRGVNTRLAAGRHQVTEPRSRSSGSGSARKTDSLGACGSCRPRSAKKTSSQNGGRNRTRTYRLDAFEDAAVHVHRCADLRVRRSGPSATRRRPSLLSSAGDKRGIFSCPPVGLRRRARPRSTAAKSAGAQLSLRVRSRDLCRVCVSRGRWAGCGRRVEGVGVAAVVVLAVGVLAVVFFFVGGFGCRGHGRRSGCRAWGGVTAIVGEESLGPAASSRREPRSTARFGEPGELGGVGA